MGRTSVGYTGSTMRTCLSWTGQTRQPDSRFPDGSRAAAGHYCRNTDNYHTPWCYYIKNSGVWANCRVNHCCAYLSITHLPTRSHKMYTHNTSSTSNHKMGARRDVNACCIYYTYTHAYTYTRTHTLPPPSK